MWREEKIKKNRIQNKTNHQTSESKYLYLRIAYTYFFLFCSSIIVTAYIYIYSSHFGLSVDDSICFANSRLFVFIYQLCEDFSFSSYKLITCSFFFGSYYLFCTSKYRNRYIEWCETVKNVTKTNIFINTKKTYGFYEK